MASRVIVPQQARGVTVQGGGENNNNNNKVHKKNAGPRDGIGRRALGDIGNLVTARPVEAKPHRPITRSFGAQLIANAEAAKAAENKKLVDVNVKGVLPNHEAPKANQKKPNHEKQRHQKKPIVEAVEVIEISPDSEKAVEKECREKQASEMKKDDIKSSSSRKKGPTLTSVLTARSKLACGITNKPKEMIMDIDAEDLNNELAVVEYIEDMYKFYKLVEHENRPHDYIESQPEINEQMRAILVDWLVEVHRKFELSPETFYLTINIMDRFLAVKTVTRRELQLVGISAMLTASKYEEIWAPEVNDFVALTAGAYSHTQVLRMEKVILGKLEWTLTVPTPYVFLVRFIKASLPNDNKVESMVYFLAELGMMHYETISYCPSMVAASAVYAARAALNKIPVWDGTLKLHTGFSEEQVTDCAKLLASLHLRASKDKLRSVYNKYASLSRGSVSYVLPARSLLPAPAADSRVA